MSKFIIISGNRQFAIDLDAVVAIALQMDKKSINDLMDAYNNFEVEDGK
jgi:hypothetical protein